MIIFTASLWTFWGCSCTSHFSYKRVDQRITSPIQHDLCSSRPPCAHFPLDLYILFSGCVGYFFLSFEKKEVMGGGSEDSLVFSGVSGGTEWLQPYPYVGNSCSTANEKRPRAFIAEQLPEYLAHEVPK